MCDGWMDGWMDGLSYTAVTPIASLQSDANKRRILKIERMYVLSVGREVNYLLVDSGVRSTCSYPAVPIKGQLAIVQLNGFIVE